jgi:hypothetical protein
MVTVQIPTMAWSGKPNLKKSEYLYPPGPYTIRFVWNPIGVEKAVAAAIMIM